jgi:hypothetical protein
MFNQPQPNTIAIGMMDEGQRFQSEPPSFTMLNKPSDRS